MDNKKYIVFLDLDGTITSVNSGYALFRTARSGKLIGLTGIARAILYTLLYRSRLLPAERIISLMGRWLHGIRPETIEAVASEASEKYLFSSIYTVMIHEICRHKMNNAELAILSSAIGGICRPLAFHLGINHVICTEMEIYKGELTGLPSGNYCFGEEKKKRIKEFCTQYGFDTKSAWYYADSISDLAALETVGNPVCVNPDRRLRKKALEKNWQVRSWKN